MLEPTGQSYSDRADKRDVTVELFRIAGALMVIGTHLKLWYGRFEDTSITRTIIACSVGDGVAVFWTILGFFLFTAANYKKRVLRCVKKVLIPATIFSILMFFLYEWIIGFTDFFQSISHNSTEYFEVFKSILKWENSIQGCAHLWYVNIYFLVVLLSPALKGLYDVAKNGGKKRIVLFVASIFVILVINDITLNGLLDISAHGINGFLGGAMFVLLGAFLYPQAGYVKGNRKLGLIGLLGIVAVTAVRAAVMYRINCLGISSDQPIFWFTGFSFLSMICLFVFLFGCFGSLSGVAAKVILRIGGKTYYIYLAHAVIIAIMNERFDLQNKLIGITKGATGIGAFAYEFIYVGIVFVTSYILSELIAGVSNFFTRR